MKSKWTLLGSILAVLLLALAAGLTQAQGPEPPRADVQPEGEAGVQAAVGARIPIQGRLTDSAGNPLNGNYSITASIYDVQTGGTALCSDTETVTVTNGLFTMNVDNCTSDDIDGRQLYLGVQVGSDAEMTDRQPIYPVPYAMSLVPGAKISYTPFLWIGTFVDLEGNLGSNISWQLGYSFPLLPLGRANYGVRAEASGGNEAYGVSGHAETSADNSEAYGLYGRADATGSGSTAIGVYGYTDSTEGYGVTGFQTGYSTADQTWFWKPGGLFGGRNGVLGLSKEPGGIGVVGWAQATSGDSRGVVGRTDSPSGWAGLFTTSSGNGVYISAPSGKIGLNVAGGTKNAVVRTNDGSRLLYTEESAEVWFTDYGFGKLQNGAAVITIDPVFAQTVNLNEPYHVFVQAYGNASLYVTNRTATGFEVRLHDGDPNVEFSYRIVAKRLGYEDQRLERAPWADNDPNLYPEKRATWEAQGGEP